MVNVGRYLLQHHVYRAGAGRHLARHIEYLHPCSAQLAEVGEQWWIAGTLVDDHDLEWRGDSLMHRSEALLQSAEPIP